MKTKKAQVIIRRLSTDGNQIEKEVDITSFFQFVGCWFGVTFAALMAIAVLYLPSLMSRLILYWVK